MHGPASINLNVIPDGEVKRAFSLRRCASAAGVGGGDSLRRKLSGELRDAGDIRRETEKKHKKQGIKDTEERSRSWSEGWNRGEALPLTFGKDTFGSTTKSGCLPGSRENFNQIRSISARAASHSRTDTARSTSSTATSEVGQNQAKELDRQKRRLLRHSVPPIMRQVYRQHVYGPYNSFGHCNISNNINPFLAAHPKSGIPKYSTSSN